MNPTDLTTVLKDVPQGEWVALSKNQTEIVASGKTLEAALAAAREKGEPMPFVMKVPPASALIL
jgi:hypothetical protein